MSERHDDTSRGWLSRAMTVEPDWIDYNGHLNMAFYNVLFDRGVDDVFETLGLGPDYKAATNHSTYVAEAHVRYVQELHEGDRVRVSFRVLDHDAKRIHSWQEIVHEGGWVAATSENMTLHVDLSGPKVAPFPDAVLERIEAMAKDHAGLPRPERAGQPVGIRRR